MQQDTCIVWHALRDFQYYPHSRQESANSERKRWSYASSQNRTRAFSRPLRHAARRRAWSALTRLGTREPCAVPAGPKGMHVMGGQGHRHHPASAPVGKRSGYKSTRLFRSSLCETKARTRKRGTVQLARLVLPDPNDPIASVLAKGGLRPKIR